MLHVPTEVIDRYRLFLADQGVESARHDEYCKWLRFFLDYCEKYHVSGLTTVRLHKFIGKLKEKGQSEDLRRRAYHAVSIYFKLTPPETTPNATPELPGESQFVSSGVSQGVSAAHRSFYSVAGYREKSDSAEWDEILGKLADEIKVRHYSRKTLKTYALWSHKFQAFLKDKPPVELTTADVKDYLTYLAVKCHVAASTQNQAFNSLLFLFRHALKRDFGELRDVPRAKKSLYIPVVLSRVSMDTIGQHKTI